MLYERRIPWKLCYLDVMGGRLHTTTEAEADVFVAVIKATIIRPHNVHL